MVANVPRKIFCMPYVQTWEISESIFILIVVWLFDIVPGVIGTLELSLDSTKHG